MSVIGNHGGASVVSTTNFNQPQENPEMGHRQVNHSNSNNSSSNSTLVSIKKVVIMIFMVFQGKNRA